ncbi:hypothetical protein GW17_00026997 [Ensete ventricosum]|nr:hypothetical protein GW17_00026997 [Ensete ventricosum]
MAKAPLQGGGRLRPGPPQGAATRGHGRLLPGRKGRPPTTSPTARRGGGAGRRGGRPLVGRLPTAKDSRPYAGAATTTAQKGERGVRASFGEKDDLAPMNLKNSEDCPCV